MTVTLRAAVGRVLSGGGSIILVEFPGLIGQVLFLQEISNIILKLVEDQFTKNEEV